MYTVYVCVNKIIQRHLHTLSLSIYIHTLSGRIKHGNGKSLVKNGGLELGKSSMKFSMFDCRRVYIYIHGISPLRGLATCRVISHLPSGIIHLVNESTGGTRGRV